MAGYYINVHLRTEDADKLRNQVIALFQAHAFRLLTDDPAALVVEDDAALPAGEDWYGVIVSGRSGAGWVSVYVADWQDSGVIAKDISQSLQTPALEIWVAEDTHWGYTYYESGQVRDRFADDPVSVAETPAEAAPYSGNATALTRILEIPPADFDGILRRAREALSEFATVPVSEVAEAVGLPFEHALIGYDDFFEDDPADYSGDLENWPAFRHLAFRHPQGKELMSE